MKFTLSNLIRLMFKRWSKKTMWGLAFYPTSLKHRKGAAKRVAMIPVALLVWVYLALWVAYRILRWTLTLGFIMLGGTVRRRPRRSSSNEQSDTKAETDNVRRAFAQRMGILPERVRMIPLGDGKYEAQVI